MEQAAHAKPIWGKRGIRSRCKTRSTIEQRQEDGCDMNIGCGDKEEKARDFAKNSSIKYHDAKKIRQSEKCARIKWFPLIDASSYPLVLRAVLIPRTSPPPSETPSTSTQAGITSNDQSSFKDKNAEVGVKDQNIFCIAFTKSNGKKKIEKPPHIPRKNKYIWPKIYDSTKPKKTKKTKVKTERKSKGDVERNAKSRDDASKTHTCPVSEQEPLADVQSPCQSYDKIRCINAGTIAPEQSPCKLSTPSTSEPKLVADEQNTPQESIKEEAIETTLQLDKKCRRALIFSLENEEKTGDGELDLGRKRSRKGNRNGSKYSFDGVAVPKKKRSRVELMDYIIKKFASLSCDTESNIAENQNYTQVCDQIKQQGQCSTCNHNGSSKGNVNGVLVGFDTDGKALIPYKRVVKKLIPKVDIDSETMRVWNLLMEKVSDAKEDENEKAAWWQEERKKLLDMIETFLYFMRLIQGHRRFSKWKGSVVDSIVGVILTQNVSDVLSSSAFMSLASRYPIKSQHNSNEGCVVVTLDTSAHVGTCSSTEECIVEENKTATTEEEITNDQNEKQQKLASEKKREKQQKQEEAKVNWDELRKMYSTGKPRDHTTYDSVDWEAVRRAPVEELAEVIKERGQNNVLAGRIKEFLDRIVQDHGSIDLEWLREVPPEKAKDFLLSIAGLGLKSVECIRLLALEHHAFPVDVNVGRIAVRLGWVPLQPLPDNVQLHELKKYPLVDNIQKYLWPRLSILDKLILYELHYQMITFGKIFCTMRNPNCKACPMKDNCKYYASKVASEKPSLPEPQKQNEVRTNEICGDVQNHMVNATVPEIFFLESNGLESSNGTLNSEPIIEVPASPGPSIDYLKRDIEDLCYDDDDGYVYGYGYGDGDGDADGDEEIPTIVLNSDIHRQNLLSALEKNNFMPQRQEESRALVAINPEAASTPARKLVTLSRLRTEHLVYELDDGSPLLEGFQRRDPDDPCPYLLAIWKTGNGDDKHSDQFVPASILIPSRTANRGSFPLNGTYFQPNEVFADDETSQNPMFVPRELLWNKPRQYLYCGTSSSMICKAMELQQVANCFRGYFCVRGFNRKTRAPRPLSQRFHPLRDTNKKNIDLDE